MFYFVVLRWGGSVVIYPRRTVFVQNCTYHHFGVYCHRSWLRLAYISSRCSRALNSDCLNVLYHSAVLNYLLKAFSQQEWKKFFFVHCRRDWLECVYSFSKIICTGQSAILSTSIGLDPCLYTLLNLARPELQQEFFRNCFPIMFVTYIFFGPLVCFYMCTTVRPEHIKSIVNFSPSALEDIRRHRITCLS